MTIRGTPRRGNTAIGWDADVGWLFPGLRSASSGLLAQKLLRLNPRLLENGPERPFRHIAGMIGNGRVAVGVWVEPDFMATRRLAVELKPQLF